MSPERLVHGCLQLLGHYELPEETRSMLEHLQTGGELRTGTEDFAQRGTDVAVDRRDPGISLCIRRSRP